MSETIAPMSREPVLATLRRDRSTAPRERPGSAEDVSGEVVRELQAEWARVRVGGTRSTRTGRPEE